MNTEMLTSFAKPIAAILGAGVTYLAENLTQDIPGVPSWFTGLGLPVAFLVCVIYALISIHKALRDSEQGRREDLKTYSERFEKLVERSNETRERLIHSTENQTAEFRSLAEHMKSRSCQK